MESTLDPPVFLSAIFESQVVKAISRKSIFESTGMESYSLALQLQAAQELVNEKMPKRALVVKLLLFTEVASALLMVQLGQFTHAGFIVIPFFSGKFSGDSEGTLDAVHPPSRPACRLAVRVVC